MVGRMGLENDFGFWSFIIGSEISLKLKVRMLGLGICLSFGWDSFCDVIERISMLIGFLLFIIGAIYYICLGFV